MTQRRAFTVVELLVAVVVLLAVIIATSKIFSTASKVSSTGEATADILQQASVIEEQMRRDLDRLTRDGYMAIQCVAVRNDVNQVVAGAGAPLLNPQLPANAVLRCDQLVFFTAGTEVSARWAGPGDLVTSGGGQQARATRVYYGHGVQFPTLPNDPLGSGSVQAKPVINGVNPPPSGARQVTPWTWYDPTTYSLAWQWGVTSNTSANAPRVTANQPEARQWVLARKAVLLADDGGRDLYYPEPTNLALAQSQGPSSAPSVFGDKSNTAGAGGSGTESTSMYQELRDRNYVPLSTNIIPSPMLQAGWVDIAASDLDKVRRAVAPTLRLQTPVYLPPGAPNGVPLESLSTPWTSFTTGFPPISWPTGGPSWPSGTTVVGTNFGGGTVGGYSTQRDRIMRGTFGIPASGTISGVAPYFGLLGWPRAEKGVPNTDRRSEILTSPVLVTNCSSFQVDWTWEPGTGRQTDQSGALLSVADKLVITPPSTVVPNALVMMRGYEPGASGNWGPNQSGPPLLARTQPWFGYPDGGDAVVSIPPADRLGVGLAQTGDSMPQWSQNGNPVNATNVHMRLVAQAVEGLANNTTAPAVTAPFGTTVPVRVYTAVFGFNQDEAYTVTPDGIRVLREDYTPFPTQLRVTCTLHDPRLVLERGRQFQFVLDVPKRRKK